MPVCGSHRAFVIRWRPLSHPYSRTTLTIKQGLDCTPIACQVFSRYGYQETQANSSHFAHVSNMALATAAILCEYCDYGTDGPHSRSGLFYNDNPQTPDTM